MDCATGGFSAIDARAQLTDPATPASKVRVPDSSWERQGSSEEPAKPDSPVAAPTLPERYRTRHECGRGGMGRIFAALDLKLGREVAIKVLAAKELTPDMLRRFEQEARAAAQLTHPNIVAIHDIGHHGG